MCIIVVCSLSLSLYVYIYIYRQRERERDRERERERERDMVVLCVRVVSLCLLCCSVCSADLDLSTLLEGIAELHEVAALEGQDVGLLLVMSCL